MKIRNRSTGKTVDFLFATCQIKLFCGINFLLMKKICAVVIAMLCCMAAFCQPGAVDSSFGVNGRLSQSFDHPNIKPALIYTQADGKIVTASLVQFDNINKVMVCRFTGAGAPDATFNGSGAAFIQSPGGNFEGVEAMQVQPDGKVLVLCSGQTLRASFLVRLTAGGVLDNSFASSGMFNVDGAYNESTEAYDMILLQNSRILLLCNTGSDTQIELLRLTAGGLPDNTFGAGGFLAVSLAPSSPNSKSQKITEQADGKLLYIAQQFSFASVVNVLLVRLNANGIKDNTFGTTGNGLVVRQVDNALVDFSPRKIVVMADGRIVAAGVTLKTFRNNLTSLKVLRYNANGTPDNTFNGNGLVSVNGDTAAFLSTGNFIIQPDNKLVFPGGRMVNLRIQNAALRLNANGSIDNAFGVNGVAIGGQVSGGQGFDITRQADGSLISWGLIFKDHRFLNGLKKYNSSGLSDDNFGTNSVVTMAAGTGKVYPEIFNIASLPDGRFYSAGYIGNGAYWGAFVQRMLPSGALDPTFGNGGFTTATNVALPSNSVNSLVLQPDGKIAILEDVEDLYGSKRTAIHRFLANGNPDSSFGLNGLLALSFNSTEEKFSYDLLHQADGKYLFDVFINDGSIAQKTYLVRLLPNGQFDNSFDGDGLLVPPFDIYGIKLQPDGKLLISGENDTAALLTRYINASPDVTFNGGVPVVSTLDPMASEYYGGILVIQPDGKILQSAFDDSYSYTLRFHPDGQKDVTFGNGGQHTFQDRFNGAAFLSQSNGKILLGGLAPSASAVGEDAAFGRLLPNGRTDSTYGVAGIVTNQFYDTLSATFCAIDTLPGGKLIATLQFANAQYYTNKEKNVFVRFHNSNLAPFRYSFTGNGNWSNPANWATGVVPPNPLPANAEVLINYAPGSQCTIDIPIQVLSGGKIIVKTGRTLKVSNAVRVPEFIHE